MHCSLQLINFVRWASDDIYFVINGRLRGQRRLEKYDCTATAYIWFCFFGSCGCFYCKMWLEFGFVSMSFRELDFFPAAEYHCTFFTRTHIDC